VVAVEATLAKAVNSAPRLASSGLRMSTSHPIPISTCPYPLHDWAQPEVRSAVEALASGSGAWPQASEPCVHLGHSGRGPGIRIGLAEHRTKPIGQQGKDQPMTLSNKARWIND